MPVEIRQLIIRSTVGEGGDEAATTAEHGPESLAALKAEILDECKAMLEARLQQMRER